MLALSDVSAHPQATPAGRYLRRCSNGNLQLLFSFDNRLVLLEICNNVEHDHAKVIYITVQHSILFYPNTGDSSALRLLAAQLYSVQPVQRTHPHCYCLQTMIKQTYMYKKSLHAG
jgi:hypothetical protein